MRYDHRTIEERARRKWQRLEVNRFDPDAPGEKRYELTMFPYPSGNLHIGHWFTIGGADTHARYMRMRGANVFFPIGFDAFGLPAENAAIAHQVDPGEWTEANIAHMREQLRSLGVMSDWSHEVVTADEEYYRWNQWLFLRMYERGLAYRAFSPVDWCPSCQTTLAREQVVGQARECERCATPVIKRELYQWRFKITEYADELLDFSELDWPEKVQTMQRNWIGRSEGALITFETAAGQLEVFTTRPETIYGASFIAIAPEHPLFEQLAGDRLDEARAWREQATRRSEIERQSGQSGFRLDARARHPLTGEEIPVYAADYVLAHYGTGAVMGVPAHDQRDWRFAQQEGLPVRPVIEAPSDTTGAFEEDGKLINSGTLNGLQAMGEGRQAAIELLADRGAGRASVSYALRDWLVSRQRFWGTPIPIVHCETCGEVPVPDTELPVRLPERPKFLPTGQSPLALDEAWRSCKCPRCGAPASRETDTMDTFVDSSWYYLRYLSPHFEDGPFDPELKQWSRPDLYTGGAEHAVMHLLYFRFIARVLHDLGVVDFREPAPRLFCQGTILGPDHRKMSKSRGNVVDPDRLVERYGADTVRMYLLFIGPWEQGGPWRADGPVGIRRFLERAWTLIHTQPKGEDDPALEAKVAGHVQQVAEALEGFRFNVAIARLMELEGELSKAALEGRLGDRSWRLGMRSLTLALAPLAPHLSEEMWTQLREKGSVHKQGWPELEVKGSGQVEIVVQVNGKLRARLSVAEGQPESEVVAQALLDERVAQAAGAFRRTVYVPDRGVLNFVV